MKNCRLIEPSALDFIQTLDYSRLMANVPAAIPSCFFEKFTGIQWVKASAIPDPDHLLWFLKSLSSLTRLHLVYSELNLLRSNGSHLPDSLTQRAFQNLCDCLPAHARSLVQLELNANGYKELKLSLDFIDEFPCLSCFTARPQDLPLKSIATVIGWLGKLAEGSFQFDYKEKSFFIEKLRELREFKVFSVYEGKQLVLSESENPEEIVDFFDKIGKACEPDDLTNFNFSKFLQLPSQAK